jgi:hypothetical protein
VWLAVSDRGAVTVYRRAAADPGWQHTEFAVRAGRYLRDVPPTVSISPGPDRLLSLVAGWGLTGSSAINHVYLSTDDTAGAPSDRGFGRPAGLQVTMIAAGLRCTRGRDR